MPLQVQWASVDEESKTDPVAMSDGLAIWNDCWVTMLIGEQPEAHEGRSYYAKLHLRVVTEAESAVVRRDPDKRAQVYEMYLRSADGIDARLVRQLPLAEMRDRAIKAATLVNPDPDSRTWRIRSGAVVAEELGTEPGSAAIVKSMWRQPRKAHERRRLTDLELAKIAAAYVDALSRGSSVTAAVQAVRTCSSSTAAHYVMAARERGILTRTSQGRVGGSLTDKARALLQEGGVE